MTRETELQQQLAEAQVEIEHLDGCVANWKDTAKRLDEKLAAQQTANAALELEVMRLRDIVIGLVKPECTCFAGCEECESSENYFDLAQRIKESAPFNPTALRDFATRIERATIERCAAWCYDREGKERAKANQVRLLANELHALPVGKINLEELAK